MQTEKDLEPKQLRDGSGVAAKHTDGSKVPVLAIGASAGGLEPYEVFFDAMPAQTGLAFVIIQHLSRSFKSMMDELLSRHTRMEIKRVTDGMVVEPNTVFLNPPHSEMTLENGCFRLTEEADETLLHLPINTFFKSIAYEYGNQAIAIVLSGTGADGTEGAQAIKEVGGTVLVQTPGSAKFDGMPISVIRNGFADVVANPDQLPDCVVKIRAGVSTNELPVADDYKDPIDRIFQLIRNRFGTEFGYYKKATILRRLQRRADIKLLCVADYADVVAENIDELESLYGDLLIEVTSFFRDEEAFRVVKENIIPDLCEKMSDTRPIRIWVPGCASGEEAYSIAIHMAETARQHDQKLNFKILATDIHHRSLNFASSGIYPKKALDGLTDNQIAHYFDVEGERAQIKSNLRRMVLFSPHDMLKDPPFTKIDFISCRNVLIYFNEKAQNKTLALFHFSLLKDGYLFLGPSETTGKLADEFTVVDKKWRVFRKARDVKLLASTAPLQLGSTDAEKPEQIFKEVPGSGKNLATGQTRNAHTLALREMLRLYAPPGFLLTRQGEVVQVFGDAGEFLKIDSGLFSSSIVELVNDELKLVVAAGLERTKTSEKVTFERRIRIADEKGTHELLIKFQPIKESAEVSTFRLLTLEKSKPEKTIENIEKKVKSVDFSEATQILQNRIQELERDLGTTEESLQSTIEELETSNEELQATNEELMASNEELQSTNEELHSVNEELYTVSSEHQRKIEELTEITDDMNHLLKATEIGIIFLDKERKIRRFTPSSTLTFNLIPEDVGRPISHVTYRFELLNLEKIIDQVVEQGVAFEEEVTVEDSNFMLRVLPYAASLDEETGVIITTIDISELKAAQTAKKETSMLYEQIVTDLSEYVVRWHASDGVISYCNQRYADGVNKTVSELIGQSIYDVMDDDENFTKSLDKLSAPGESNSFYVKNTDSDGNQSISSGIMRALGDSSGKITAYQATGVDVTEIHRYQLALESLLRVDERAVDVDHNPILEILRIGTGYFQLSCGFVSQIIDDVYHLQQVTNESTNSSDNVLHAGDRISLKESVFTPGPDEEVLALSQINEGGVRNMEFRRGSSEATESLNVAATISVWISTSNGVYGTLTFYGSSSLPRQFSEEQILFAKLLSQTVGYQLERSQQLENVNRRRQHYQQLYYQTPIMMCTVDKSTHLLEANEEFLKQLAYPRHNVIGRSLEDLSPNGSLKEILATRFVESEIRKTPIDLISNHGSVVRTELSAMQRTELGSEDISYLLVLEDVTDRDAALREVKHQKAELQASNEGLSQFAYIASHDLQEPLRKIRQFGDLLDREYSDALVGDGQYYLDVITNASERIIILVRDLLDYSRTANVELELKPTNLQQIFKDVLTDLDALLEESNAQVTSNELPTVIADSVAVSHLFRNLISNGIKYQSEGNQPEISVVSNSQDSKTVIHFSDNGIGIAGDTQQRIFEPFVRLEKRSAYSGTGIGLAICKTVCDRLDWGLSYQSTVGKGTTFSVSIPKKSYCTVATAFRK